MNAEPLVPLPLTSDEVRWLNLPAINLTQFYRDEHGMDWNAWHYFPSSGRAMDPDFYPGQFSDGHSHGDCHMEGPHEGWTLINKSEIKMFTIKYIVAMKRELEAVQLELHKAARSKKQVDRQKAAGMLSARLNDVIQMLR